MGVLIDSSVLIGWERTGIDLARAVAGRETEAAYLSVITVSELLHGVHRAPSARVRNRRLAYVEAILRGFPVLEVDSATARVHAQTWAAMEAAGTRIGAHDLWLAATCLMHDLRMVTHNLREFRSVPGLEIEAW
jgi:tRNA(fMet)-specific endonuclease VapC